MADIIVIGIGGAGCSLAAHIQKKVSFDSLAIDRAQYLPDHNFTNKIEIPEQMSAGHELPDSYKQEILQAVEKHLSGSSSVVLAVGLGGNLGTALGIEVAKLASNMGIKVVCAAYLPFAFEGGKRRQVSLNALNELRMCTDEIVVHDNSVEIVSAESPSQSLLDYFKAANESLMKNVNAKLLAS
jgi:cell division GTPase FtsZ